MPAPNERMGGKRDPIQWVHIDDFSPGCYDGGHISTQHPVDSAPLGAANREFTYCCAVVPGGALGPLPQLNSSLPFSTIGGLPGAATLALIAGFSVTPQLNVDSFEIVTIVEADDGSSHYVVATSYVPASLALNTIAGPTITSASVAGFFGAPYPAFTRMNASGSPGPPPPSPKLVFPTAGDASHLWVYPSIAAPTTFVADDIIGGSITGQVITYGNRVIVMAGVDYGWPAGTGVNTNENFNYTDPPESAIYGNQQEIFAVETPWGYGAFGSVSVGELLLIKKYGGAVILNGDINVPTSLIRVPGVQSTGDFVGRACATPIGLIYCSQNRGAWIWNGGNTSQKISRNIDDTFFDLESGNIESNNYGFFVDQWQKWVLFSGNVMYDTETNSWWNLFPRKGNNISGLPNGRDFWWYNLTTEGYQIAAAPLYVQNNSDPWVSFFDNRVPTQVYTWQSLPIHVTENADRVVDVRQVVIRASDPTNTGTATVTLAVGTFAETSNATDNPIGVNPTPLRFNVGNGAQGLDDIILNLTANNPTSFGSAPVIHSIDVGYKVRAAVGVAD